METVEGIIKITKSGLGFIDREGQDSIKINSDNLNTALHNDRVVVSLSGVTKVVKILERAKVRFTGTVIQENNKWFVSPDDKKIHLNFYLPKEEVRNLKLNQKVLIEMREWENPSKN